MNALFSISEKSPTARTSRRLKLPYVASTNPVSSPCGLREMRRMAPPRLFLPNSVPCGPRSTSTRSRSIRSMDEPVSVPWYTSSMYTPTVGSNA
jgi:hypothetical protein